MTATTIYLEVNAAALEFLIAWFVITFVWLIPRLIWTRLRARQALKTACAIIRNEGLCHELSCGGKHGANLIRWATECAKEGGITR